MVLHLATVSASRTGVRIFAPAVILSFKNGIWYWLNRFAFHRHLHLIYVLHSIPKDMIERHQSLFMTPPEDYGYCWGNERNNVRHGQVNRDKIFFPFPVTVLAE